MENKAVNLSDLVGSRLDAKFVLLSQKHKEAAKELAQYNRDELVELAKRLPFNPEACQAVWPISSGPTQAWLDVRLTRREARLVDIIVYVAAASEYLVSKRLLEIKKLKEQELAILKDLKGVLATVSQKGSIKVLEMMKGKHDGSVPTEDR